MASDDHPIFRHKSIRAKQYAGYPHALVTVRRDATGFIDKRLAEIELSRRVTTTTPYMFALGAARHGTDLVATLPRRAADKLTSHGLRQFELPFLTEPWSISMTLNAASELEPSQVWLREGLVKVMSGERVPVA